MVTLIKNMIPTEIPQQIATQGDTSFVGHFKITEATQARILVSLSDKMYTNKQLAAIREYSTNAADAHAVVNKPISEIIVTFPTMDDLNFSVRDFGTGLNEDQIRNVYCVFGESTKRNSNEFNGLLGYGCKAGFASADSFTVTSWNNGTKSIYQCIKGDTTKLHSAILLSRSNSDEPTGIEVKIPVQSSDMWSFHREATHFYKYWPVLPTMVNMNESYQETMKEFHSLPAILKGEGWEIRPKGSNSASAVAYMGWVPYSVNLDTMYHRMSLDNKSRGLFEILKNNEVTFYFKMGELQFVDSREQLEYTSFTIDALSIRIKGIFSSIKDSIQSKISTGDTLWDAKIIYNSIFGYNNKSEEKVDGDNTPDNIKMLNGDLSQFEETFKNSFSWNGIIINGNKFSHINRFDNITPDKVNNEFHSPNVPVMITYRKKKSRAKVCRCKVESNNRICASNTTAVVINDTKYKNDQSLVARYLIFTQNYTVVNVLKFHTDVTKDLFYNEYKFDSVPVIKLSEIISSVKEWNKSLKDTFSLDDKSRITMVASGTRRMKYMDINLGMINESDIPLRDIVNGGYYIEAVPGAKNKIKFGDATRVTTNNQLIRYIKILSIEFGANIEKVFIINTQTQNSQWFKNAIRDNKWVNIYEDFKGWVSRLNPSKLLTHSIYSNYELDDADAKQFLSKLVDKNSSVFKFVNSIKKKSNPYVEVVDALKSLNLWSLIQAKDTDILEEHDKFLNEFEMKYPLISISDLNFSMNPKEIDAITNYINAIEFYNSSKKVNIA